MLAGCAGVQVRASAPTPGNPAYDLRGPDLADAVGAGDSACARRGMPCCAQWQRGGQLAGVNADSASADELRLVRSATTCAPDQAQMSIVCQA